MSSTAGSSPTSDKSLDEPDMRPIPVKIHPSVIYSDAKIDIGASETFVCPPISFDYFIQDIHMAVFRNDDNIKDKLATVRIVDGVDVPLDVMIRKALFFLQPSRDTLSANLSITDDDTLKQALENIGQSDWSDEILMWLNMTHRTALGFPVPALVDGNLEIETPMNVDQSVAV